MLNTIRAINRNDRGATAFENGMLAVIAILAAVMLLGQVNDSVSDIFHNQAIQADTDRQFGR